MAMQWAVRAEQGNTADQRQGIDEDEFCGQSCEIRWLMGLGFRWQA